MADKPNLSEGLNRVWAENGTFVDPDTIITGKVDLGWVVEVADFEFQNWISHYMTKYIAHVNERGVPVWDANTTYVVSSYVVGSDGEIYKSNSAANLGNDPTSTGQWDLYQSTFLNAATEILAGIVELATQIETNAGLDDTKAITPLKLAGRTATQSRAGIIEIPTQTETNTGVDDTRAITPLKLAGRVASETLAGIIPIATQGEVDTGTNDTDAVTSLKLQSKLDDQGLGLHPFLGVTTATHTFVAANTWETVLVDAGRANEWVWIVLHMPQGTDNSTVYFRNGTQGIGQLPEYVIGIVTSGSIGSINSVPVQLNASGEMSINSTRIAITVRVTMRGQWGLL